MKFVTEIKEPHKINVYWAFYNGFDSRYLLVKSKATNPSFSSKIKGLWLFYYFIL